MSAGTVVISGGLLATVILLCIVAVLCYCRLQYYCCKKNESEVDLASVAGGGDGTGGGEGDAQGEVQAHFACNACSAPGMDSLAVTPLCLEPLEVRAGPPPSYCPTCSPFWLRPGLSDELHNGTERLGFHTYHYDNPGLCQSLPLSDTPQAPFFLTQPGQSPLSYYSPVDIYPNTPCSNRRPYSTPV
ncbi:protein FAM163A-like [Salvelinus sp. IW2-2015]|uniref:protein FAM163A-like n=1 Tax=Salvelinus sp. IW2-2015 TaxID=2691554 RepID=UPI0038D3D565